MNQSEITEQHRNELHERVNSTCHYGHPSGQMLKVEDVRKIINEVMI